MSMHKTPMSEHEELGVRSHRLVVGKPCQSTDFFRAGYAWAAQNQGQDGWISVDDNEPPLEQEVLVIYESGIITTGWRRQFRPEDILYCLGTKDGNWDMEINNDLGGIVTHWQPLPKPPTTSTPPAPST